SRDPHSFPTRRSSDLATLAFTEPAGRWDASGIALTAKQAGGGWQLDGVKLFVPDAEAADYIAVAARTRGEGEEGITLFLVKGRRSEEHTSELQSRGHL